jgi:hypothetical protein
LRDETLVKEDEQLAAGWKVHLMIVDHNEEAEKDDSNNNEVKPWLSATVEDAQSLNFETPIIASTTADCMQLNDQFQATLKIDQERESADDAATRVYNMLVAITGMYFRPAQRNEPFSAMLTLADGRRSPIPEDFRGAPLETLAYMAEEATNSVLRARLSDVCWLLDRKRGRLGSLAISSYVEIVRKADAGQFKWRFTGEDEDGGLQHDARDYLRRALQIGRAIGWEKAETVAARLLLIELRKRANGAGMPNPVYWFSSLDLDLSVSDPAEVAEGVDDVLQSLQGDTNSVIDLWRLAARAHHLGRNNDDAHRCQSEAAECLVAEAERTLSNSAMLAAHNLSAAIAELHGIPGKKDRRTELRHRLIDVQALITEEMSLFSKEIDLREIAEGIERGIKKLGLMDQLFVFADLIRSPSPNDLVKEATETIQKYPLSSLFGATHHDSEGKVVHRTEGGAFGDSGADATVRQQIAQNESIRRRLIAFGEIEVARRAINEQHYLSDDVFASLLQYSPFVPNDLLATFSRGFSRFFRGDFISATYILIPLLENSLRHILKLNGHDVTIFDDATQTQQDRTISSLFEQMRPELDVIFTHAITTDIDNVFLTRPGPCLRHSVAHGLLRDGDPHGPDAIYGCTLIMRLCLVPLFRHRDTLKSSLDFA